MSHIPLVRVGTSNSEVSQYLELLADLAGTWHGTGFNLIGRPDKEGNAPLFLELNQTQETFLKSNHNCTITASGSRVSKRRFICVYEYSDFGYQKIKWNVLVLNLA
jgi:hypothetical protein